MRIFALETNIDKLQERFKSKNETFLMIGFHHGFMFFLKIVYEIFVTIVLLSLGTVMVEYLRAPADLVTLFFLILWMIVVPYPLLRKFIDWKYDFFYVTTDKIVVVDQSSIFRQHISQLSLENVRSVSAQTQFWDIFPFGTVKFSFEEGGATNFVLKYIPNAAEVADTVADAVIAYQQRKNERDVAPAVAA